MMVDSGAKRILVNGMSQMTSARPKPMPSARQAALLSGGAKVGASSSGLVSAGGVVSETPQRMHFALRRCWPAPHFGQVNGASSRGAVETLSAGAAGGGGLVIVPELSG